MSTTEPVETTGASGFESLPGAVGSPPEHYGNPVAEQRALASGSAIVDLSDREVVALTGEDRLTWLDSITSQSIDRLAPGESAETLLLDPSGRVQHAIRVVDDGATAWLLVDAGAGADLAAFLERMKFFKRVEVSLRDDLATVGTLGDAPTLDGVDLVTWSDPWREVVAGGVQYAAHDGHPAADWTWSETLVPRDRRGDLAAGGRPAAGTLAAEALRIAAWRPREATEVDATTIPHELDWLRTAVHLTKGCYRGQETVAKVHNLGHPPRRLVMLHLDGSEGALPEPGADVLLGDAVVGRVTASARHHELGPIALAVLKRNAEASAPLVVKTDDGLLIAAGQQVVVPPSAGASVDVPRMPRLARR